MSIEDRCIAPVPFRDKPHSHFFKKVGMRGNGVHREIYADTPQFPLDFAYAYIIIYA